MTKCDFDNGLFCFKDHHKIGEERSIRGVKWIYIQRDSIYPAWIKYRSWHQKMFRYIVPQWLKLKTRGKIFNYLIF